MAPNLPRVTVLSRSLADLKVVHPKDIDFQPPAAIDSDSYWEWNSTAPVDLFSADHIVANLERHCVIEEQATNPDTDSYWAENDTVDSDEYWTESTSHKDANYWAEQAAPSHHNQEESTRCCPHESSYWDEATHKVTPKDEYWAERTESLFAS